MVEQSKGKAKAERRPATPGRASEPAWNPPPDYNREFSSDTSGGRERRPGDDISTHQAAERRADAARAYAQAMVDAAGDPMVVIDPGLRVVSANQSFYRLFAAAPETAIGHRLSDGAARQLDTPELRALLDSIEHGSEPIEGYQSIIELPTLGQRTLSVVAKRLAGADVESDSVLIALHDITDFKRIERALTEAGQTSELANLAKSHLLAAASHDLRQPLQTLSLLLGALKQRIVDKQALAVLAMAERASKTMAGILATLLDLNQIERGAIRPSLVQFPIDNLLDALDTEFAALAAGKGLTWRRVPCRLFVRSDPRLIEHMARNILSNAIRYTDGGKILLGCRRRGDRLRLEVWDTGRGIPAEHIPRIFEEYHQVPDTARRGGLGLGLAIVQRFGDLLGHAIDVRSRLGKGSVFSIELPVVAGPTSILKPPAPARRRPRAGRTGSVLVIEDEAAVRESLAALLRAHGHGVTVAPDGTAARQLVAAGLRPDLVISDYNLPGDQNGVATAVDLRRALGQVPTIILSGDVRAETLRDIAQSGCTAVTKPAKPEDISQLVLRLLDEAARSATAPTLAPAAQEARSDPRPTVSIVDDHGDTRDALRLLLQRAGHRVRAYPNAESFLAAHRADDNGCVIADVRMPGMSGLEMLARLAAAGDVPPTIVITGQADIGMAVEAMRAGAVEFIEKPVEPENLLAAVERALRHAASPADRSATQTAAAMRLAGLTPREREVLKLIVAGLANKQVAARLGINRRTVETHRAMLMRKLGVHSLSDLVRLEIAAYGGDE